MIDPHNKQLPVDIIAQVVHDFFFYQLKFQQFLVISWGNKVMLDTVNFIGCHLKVKSTVFCYSLVFVSVLKALDENSP